MGGCVVRELLVVVALGVGTGAGWGRMPVLGSLARLPEPADGKLLAELPLGKPLLGEPPLGKLLGWTLLATGVGVADFFWAPNCGLDGPVGR